MRGAGLGWVLVGGVLLVGGCTSDDGSSSGVEQVNLSVAGDPVPQPSGDPVILDSEPASLRQDGVAVEVAADSVASEATLRFGQSLGAVGDEYFGRPVGLELSEPLAAPVELRWEIGGLTQEQRASIVPLRWDEGLQVWAVDSTDAQMEIVGDELVIFATGFSWRSWSWAADFGQLVGERTGSRREGPSCEGDLPGWVTNVVDPGAGTSAAAIQVCFEPDDDDVVTVRVVNNRPFTQRLDMSEGGQSWAWTWPGHESFGVSAAVDVAARKVFDSRTTHLLPPLSETAVGIAQPQGDGSHFVAATASVDATTFLVDAVDYLLSKVSPGGFDSALANEFAALVYECGGSATLSGTDFGRVSTELIEVVASCIVEVMTSDTGYGARFDTFRIEMMDSASNDTVRAQLIKENRALHQLASAARVLEAGKLTFYFTDQLQNAYVGDLTLSISGNGLPSELGAWTPTCDDLAADSNRLFRNLTLRDPFYDTSRELWEFEELEPAAEQAVQPLQNCSAEYLRDLATHLPGDWADRRAADIVAGRLAGLIGPSAEVQELLDIWAAEDLACRGGPGDIETNRACNRRADAQEALDALGWCVGRRSDPPGERGQWHQCGPDSYRASDLPRYPTSDDQNDTAASGSRIAARWGSDGPMVPLGSDEANGSGCSPGSSVLPDGVWFGFVRDLGDRHIAFDLACLYTGQRAYAQGADPEGADIAVRNDVLDERAVAVSPDARFFVHPDHDISSGNRLTFRTSEIRELRQHLDQRMGLELWSDAVGVWILIDDGRVVEMLEFWHGFVS